MIFHVIMASFNRRDVTVTAIRLLFESAQNANAGISVVLFDDGSTDGTAAEVNRQFPSVTVINGTGDSFWAKGMAAAEQHVLRTARRDGNPYIIWLNDDVQLDLDALDRLIPLLKHLPEDILVGAVRDPESGEVTYSGMQKSGRHPLRFDRVQPSALAPIEVLTFNGNLVVVPISLADKLGGIDGKFSHALADIDYGLRARAIGAKSWLAPKTFGTCALNAAPAPLPIFAEWRRFTGIKGGGNLGSLVRILRKIVPNSWPLYIAATYALWWIRSLAKRLKRA